QTFSLPICPVHELEPLAGDGLPVSRRDALAHDSAGDRGELVVDVADAFAVDLLADPRNGLVSPVGLDERVEVGRRSAGRQGSLLLWWEANPNPLGLMDERRGWRSLGSAGARRSHGRA